MVDYQPVPSSPRDLDFIGSIEGTHFGAGEAQIGSTISVPAGLITANDQILLWFTGFAPDAGPLDLWITDSVANVVKLSTSGYPIQGNDNIDGQGHIEQGVQGNTAMNMIGTFQYGITDILAFGMNAILEANWITKNFTIKAFGSNNPFNTATYKLRFYKAKGS